MGCASSTPDVHADREAEARSAAIEKALAGDREKLRNEIKLLMLGAGESGKSTVVKQFRLAYGDAYTHEQRLDYRSVIFENVVSSICVVIDAFELLSIDVPASLLPQAELLMSLGDEPDLEADGGELVANIAAAITALWDFDGAKEAVDMSHEFQLNDSASYYFDNIARLASPSYIPTDDDILRSRVKSTGIVEAKLNIHGTNYRIVDVGGQRSERKKWISCFGDVNVLLFVLAISEYNQMLYEDESVSRLSEAITLWQSIANSKWFSAASIILFLNKTDLFRQKLKLYKLSDSVPEYNGPNDFASTTEYLSRTFAEVYAQPKPLIMHLTCATDTNHIRVVLSAVQEQIITANLANAGMM